MTKPRRKSRLWQIDPSTFQPLRKAGILERRLLEPAKALGRNALYIFAFAYPATIVSIGIIFGGLVFWTVFAGSIGLIWLIITRTGYAQNFADWDIGYRKFLGLLGGFAISIGFLYTLLYLKTWALPVVIAGLAVTFVLGLWKKSKSRILKPTSPV